MPTDRSHAMDHLVVLMFENRSFDNLLGRLYEPGEVASFEGVAGKDLVEPHPGVGRARVGPQGRLLRDLRGYEYPEPRPRRGVPARQHAVVRNHRTRGQPGNVGREDGGPYNAPAPGQQPSMDGFVADYISAFTAEMGRQPTYDEYGQIMSGYTPEQMPVFSGLARGFATFDHWFCEVPSQTFTNRSFFHAATASGYVVNLSPPDSFPVHNTAETIFERLESKGLTWKVYCDPPAHVSFTALIHAARLKDRFATQFVTTDQFYEDAEKGELPTYSFIEPNLIHGHNDMHPPENAILPGFDLDLPSSLHGGEALLAKVYNAVRSSSSAQGSNVYNTLLMINFDEHGGTYDHVPPPPAPSPDPSSPAGQYGFTFNRSGIRVPAIAISPWIPPRRSSTPSTATLR